MLGWLAAVRTSQVTRASTTNQAPTSQRHRPARIRSLNSSRATVTPRSLSRSSQLARQPALVLPRARSAARARSRSRLPLAHFCPSTRSR